MAYTATISNLSVTRERISKLFYIMTGTCNLSSYNQTGVEVIDITRWFKETPMVICEGLSSNGYAVNWNSEGYFQAYSIIADATLLSGNSPPSWSITDNDSAAVNGVQVYLRTNDFITGWLEFVSPTNTNGVARLGSTGPYIVIVDNDNAADGYPVYVLSNLEGDGALLVNPSDPLEETPNGFIHVGTKGPYEGGPNFCLHLATHSDPVTAGDGPLYFDEDAANNYERLMFVSDLNTDQSYTLARNSIMGLDRVGTGDYTVSWEGAVSSEASNDLDIGTFDFMAIGRRK